jgi:putative nucleotidyltransferase with HDIG domain
VSVRILESDPEVEALLRSVAPRQRRAMPRREALSEGLFALGLVGAIAGLVLAAPDLPARDALWPLAIGLAALYALALQVSFTVGAGCGSAVQLAYVPMLVLMPPALTPVLVLGVLILTRVPEYVMRRRYPDRLVVAFGDTWFTIGPALLLTLLPVGHVGPGDWWIFALCLPAQLVTDMAVSSAREWLGSGVRPGLQLRLHGFVVLVDTALTPIALVVGIAAVDHPFVLLAVLPVLALLALLSRERERRIAETLALSHAYRGSALLMGEMLEADDPYTGGEHSRGVVVLALAVGRELGLDARAQRDLEFGALLHDIGKLRTPDTILNKPGPLTEDEWAVIRRHPIDGQAMLDRIGGALSDVGRIVRAHHERWDGDGYPDGLRGEQIPLGSRVVAVCDAFDAMTTNRPYRRRVDSAVAMAELRTCSGTQFDPSVVDAFARVLEREMAAAAETSAVRAVPAA